MAGKVNRKRLENIIRREMDQCVGLPGGRLSSDRDMLKNAYYGTAYAVDGEREANGWSTYIDRTVLETVEWAKGPLLKVFAGSGDLVRFEPSAPDDEQYAQDATDYVNRVVFGANAFDLVYGPLTDGLYQRVGWAKVYVDDKEQESGVTREMDGLSQDEAQAVIAAAQQNGSRAEVTQDKETGLYSVSVAPETSGRNTPHIRIMPLPSERVIYSGDATDIATARFVAHWEDRMAGELIAEGYSREMVKSLPSDDDDYPETRTQRNVNDDSADASSDADDRSDGSRTIRVYEAYVYADVEGNGELQRLKVTYAGGNDKCVVLDAQDWTMGRPPIFAACSLPLPYSPVGLSMADLVADLQKLRTEMMRDVLDNMYLANHGEMFLRRGPGSSINMDQFLSRTPGGVYEGEGDIELSPLPVGNISTLAISGLELTDKAREQRTGIGMSNQGLSADVLQNTATGAAILEEAQNVRLEMIARVYAETFYKPMARYALALACKYIREPVNITRQGKFAAITPAEWNPEMCVTVTVGLGTGSRQKQASSVQQVMSVQNHIATQLEKSSPVRLTHIIRAAHKLAESLGFESPEQYFGTIEDAEQAEQAIMEQEQPPSPEQQKLQLQQEQAQQKIMLEREKAQADLQNDAARMRMEMALRVEELRQKGMLSQRQMELEAELDAIKMVTDLPKGGTTEVKQVDTL